jgi:putative cell wall-binding protein
MDVDASLIRNGIAENDIHRIYGDDRMQTADRVEAEVMKYSTADTVIICSGGNFPDALSISSYAFAQKMPILLTGEDGNLTAESLAIAKGFKNAVIIGGKTAVSTDTETQLSGLSVGRYGGNDRYGTSTAIISGLFGGYAPALAIATGEDYPDALVGAALAGQQDGAILLVDGQGSTLTADQEAIVGNAGDVWILGGGQAISAAMKSAIDDILK